jgi:aminomethyltransferase
MPTNSPLHECFRAAGARFEERGGWLVPVAVAGRAGEYLAIRHGVGISDVSDMGKLRVSGDGAAALLDRVVAGNVDRLVENSIRWTVILHADGRVLADVQVYNDFGAYLVTCAGSRRDEVAAVLRTHAGRNVRVDDVTAELAAVAVEGPCARDIPSAIAGIDASGLPLLRFTRCRVDGGDVLVSRIGFSGEFGYLFFVHPSLAAKLVAHIRRVAPVAELCGRDVQDLHRLEVRAFHQDRDVVRGETALEAGLHWMIDFRKPEFRGSAAVHAEVARGVARRLVAFEADGRVAPGRGDPLYMTGTRAGYVANGAWSPALGRVVGLAYLDEPYAWVGLELEARTPDGRPVPVRTVSAPLLVTASTRVAG